MKIYIVLRDHGEYDEYEREVLRDAFTDFAEASQYAEEMNREEEEEDDLYPAVYSVQELILH